MAGFYSGADSTTPPLHWPTIAPEFTPGIPTEMRDMVREPFFRLERSRARTTGGSGLGLAIVSNLIARNKGRFTISDAPGGGARMIVDLPQFRADRAR
jgi:signal transduction histidine kinase